MAKISVKELVAKANEQVTTLSPDEALAAQKGSSAVLVDIRDVRELNREGRIEDAVHAPRGMLEFWFDEESPYHREVFAKEDQTYILFCVVYAGSIAHRVAGRAYLVVEWLVTNHSAL